MRYEKECQQIAEMAKNALNFPKNACKGDFEGITLVEIYEIFQKEVIELEYELFNNRTTRGWVIDFTRAREELSDVVASCVGLLAKINSLEKGDRDER